MLRKVGGTLERVPARLLLLAGVLLALGCGSSSKVSGTLESLTPGSDRTVALTPGDADFAPGPVRYSFLVIGKDGRLVTTPRAAVWLARGLKEKPFQRAVATLEPIGVPGSSTDVGLVKAIYVVHLSVPAPGKYWVLAKPDGSNLAGLGNLVVAKRTASPALGARAIPSQTPTLTTAGGRLASLSTSTKPDRALYTTSIAQALAAHRPFVVTFATPKFCSSRTCGPVVDVVSHVRKQPASAGVTFIHVEVFNGNDPSKGYNRWVKEWKLPSEPWTFVVGRDGRIKAKFEGSVSAAELLAAVRAL